MILLIDNYDSFTFNLYQQLTFLGQEVRVYKNDQISLEEIEKLKLRAIVISPGPGNPDTAGNCLEIVRALTRQIPILGICLGHQIIAQVLGAQIVPAKNIEHGRVSEIYHDGESLFKRMPSPMKVTRYHSLSVQEYEQMPFLVNARANDQEVMAITHGSLPVFGLQFHPESYGTEYGIQFIQNFLEVIDEYPRTDV